MNFFVFAISGISALTLAGTLGAMSAENHSQLMENLLSERGISEASVNPSQPESINTTDQAKVLRSDDLIIRQQVQSIVADFRNPNDFYMWMKNKYRNINYILGGNFLPLAEAIVRYQTDPRSDAEKIFNLARLLLEAYVLIKEDKPLSVTNRRKDFRFSRLLTMEYLKKYPLSSENHRPICARDLDKVWKYCSQLRDRLVEPCGNTVVCTSPKNLTPEKFINTKIDEFLQRTSFPPEKLLEKILYRKHVLRFFLP